MILHIVCIQRIALVYCVVALIETYTTKLRPSSLKPGQLSIFSAYQWQWWGKQHISFSKTTLQCLKFNYILCYDLWQTYLCYIGLVGLWPLWFTWLQPWASTFQIGVSWIITARKQRDTQYKHNLCLDTNIVLLGLCCFVDASFLIVDPMWNARTPRSCM